MLFDILDICNFIANILANMQASKGLAWALEKKTKKLPSCSCAHVHGKVGGVFPVGQEEEKGGHRNTKR